MQSQRVNSAQVQQAMAEEVAEAMNGARDGQIIADTEEWVRQTAPVFREQLYSKVIRLLQDQQEALSPSARRAAEQGPPVSDASDGERASERA